MVVCSNGANHLSEATPKRNATPWRCQSREEASASRLSPSLPGKRRTWSTVASYLVDPASSHMLVSKIKPCMSKYERSSL